jgi:nicotinate-nucleotide--dimethylbenzimidazole phosphoribosyltransferase
MRGVLKMREMTMSKLDEIIQGIKPVSFGLQPDARKRLDNLTKPPGSLGVLEDIAAKYCMITDTIKPTLDRKRIYTFAGDHGVTEEGVSCFPKEVTPQMVLNMLNGGAAINVLTRQVGSQVLVVDVGVDYDFDNAPGLIKRKVKRGTDNMAKGPAMSEEEAVEAIMVGVELALEAKKDGISLLGTGEMGIGNTTSSSALFAALLPCSVEDITGRGTGICDDTLRNKMQVIKKVLEVNKNRLNNPISALAAVGGLEIAAICGLCLGAAYSRIPVVVDGFISSAGAFVATKISDKVSDYLFFSHRSKERGHSTFIDKFGVRPILDLDLRLGEGTGAALAMNVIEAAIRIYNEMATFGEANVSEG